MPVTRWSSATHLVSADQQEALLCLRRVAAAQHGRASTAQAARVGCAPATVVAVVRHGEAVRPRRGLLRFAAAPEHEPARDWETVLAAGADPTTAEVLAQRAAERKVADGEAASLAQAREMRADPPGQDVALCRATALRALGVERARQFDHGDVLVHGSSPPTVPWATVHRTRRLARCDVTRQAGVPTTTGARSLLDLGSDVAWADRLALADDVLCARLSSREWLHRRAVALRPGRPHIQPIVDLTGDGAEELFHSWLERQGGRLVADAGLPAPRWQVPVDDDRGRIGVVDACWRRDGPRRDVVWELEGLRFHTAPAQRRRDADRFNRLTLRHVVVRHTWEDVVRDPQRVVADLERGLAQP